MIKQAWSPPLSSVIVYPYLSFILFVIRLCNLSIYIYPTYNLSLRSIPATYPAYNLSYLQPILSIIYICNLFL